MTKRHTCNVPGCAKAFSRPSHLQRHALNHSDIQLICERCKACFKRLDLLERHKARHTDRDKRAGGVGLGILETKSKHFTAASVSASASVPSPNQASSPPDSRYQLPSVSEPQYAWCTYTSRKTSNVSESVSYSSHEPEEHWNSPQQLPGPDLASYFNSQLNCPNASQMANMYMDQPLQFYKLEDMYYDMKFDLVHFNETSFAPQISDYRQSTYQPLPENTVQPSRT
ncbi:hypothetical protein NA56DRAFT_213191 [Hyaloscypha hepaticicola]|uniref:C2H2-type domain-containing protein n=1 Tax=Hyaloscypha hepaticicola TaxID=2082293 RepID=A0A2J6PYE9_9HELO|nr:hypothetical protein NA56DRAFT_213191 [Hyaloscypha hepaticicola]